LEGHVVQLGITFDAHAEIYLNDRKYQICSVIVETPTWELRCYVLHVKNVLGHTR
jgi:hypothetical protein